MNARVSRVTPIRSASGDSLRTVLASSSPASRALATRAPTAAEIDALCTITPAKLRPLANSKVSAENLSVYAASLERHRRAGEINSLLRVTHFVSQLAHECLRFSRMVESFAYSAARAGLMLPNLKSAEEAAELLAKDTTGEALANHVYVTTNGNNKPGDGYRYRGRGFIQLTGRGNYETYSNDLLTMCADLVGNPDLATEPDIAARVAVSFWKKKQINLAAERDDVEAVTKKINGGRNGLEERRQLLEIAKASFYPRP